MTNSTERPQKMARLEKSAMKESAVVVDEEADKLVKKCAAAARAGTLLIIADFDRTITRCYLPNGDRGQSAHGILEAGKVFSDEFQAKAADLLDKYYPIEIDPTIPIKDKIPIMKEWYSTSHSQLTKENVTKQQLSQSVADCDTMLFRDGMAELIRGCQEAEKPIPFIIMSAGIGNVIEEFLQQRLPFPLAESTKVVSNRMLFNDEDRLVDFAEPLIHMFNKSAGFFPDDLREFTARCDCCLLLGDGIGDITMADGLSADLLKVGFLNEKIDERFAQYREGFNIIVKGDGPVPQACFDAIGMPPCTCMM